MHIPGLRTMLTERTTVLQEKLEPASTYGIIDVKERQTLYLISPTVGTFNFESITVNYAKEIIAFKQVNRDKKGLSIAVLHALRELGIHDFSPYSMSFTMKSSNRPDK
ncbi:hypothetical protein [Sporosarcina sp. A2]|uniref:hypothetical protein n=1 Tax=Sporosarcina sp. A2 TaxID=3393449 RepID=UPI003D7B20B9